MSLMEIDVTPEETAIARGARGRDHIANLVRVLGDGSAWEYRGLVDECNPPTGVCSCGHQGLRYLFTLHHADGRTAVVGSSCIETYPGINPAVLGAIDAEIKRLQAAARERIRAAKFAAQSQVVADLMAEWSALEFAADEIALAWVNNHASGAYRPYAIYKRYFPGIGERAALKGKQLHPYCRVPALKTPAGQSGRIKSKIAGITREIEELRAARGSSNY